MQSLQNNPLSSLSPSTQNQIKSLLLSHHHSTSALVSEILTGVLQTVQNNNKLHMDSTYLQIHIYTPPPTTTSLTADDFATFTFKQN